MARCRLATASHDETARVWDAETGAALRVLRGHVGDVYSIAWSPGGRRLATVSVGKTVRVWDAGTGAELHVLSDASWVVLIAWSPGGRRLATAYDNSTARVWAV